MEELDDDVAPRFVADVDGLVNFLTRDVSENDMPVLHRGRFTAIAISVDPLQDTTADSDVEEITLVAMQTGTLTGFQGQVPHADALVFEKGRVPTSADTVPSLMVVTLAEI